MDLSTGREHAQPPFVLIGESQDVNLAQSKVNKKYGVLGLGRISH